MLEQLINKLSDQITKMTVELAMAQVDVDVANSQIAYINSVLDSEPALLELFKEAEAKLIAEKEGRTDGA